MDHRLRPEHDVASPPQHHYHSGTGQVVYRPSLAQYSGDQLRYSGVAAAGFPAGFPVQPASVPDVRVFHAEIARLRQLLSAAQTQNAQQNLQTQHAAHRAAQQAAQQARTEQASRFSAQIDALKKQLADLGRGTELQKQQLKDELSLLRTQHEGAKESVLATAAQAETLKRELSNVANAASAEQQSLKQHYQSVLSRQDAIRRDNESSIERLQSQLDESIKRLAQWQLAHANAVTLCEMYDREGRNDADRFATLQDEYDRFKERASEGFALCEEEIEMLENTIAILRTDHEAVELTNADLDHRNDELESVLHELQSDLESVLVKSSRDRQESRRAIDTLEEQFHATNIRLIAASEEKKSLVESLANLKRGADEFDASLFAKDQEINATKKLADESQRQIQQLRREHAVLGSQNEEMRNRIRALAGDVSDLQGKLVESEGQVARADEAVAERDRQMREIQSAARAAEANATLRASEAEQQYAIELERLETAIQQQNESQSQVDQIESDSRTRIAELESQLVASQHAAEASSAEKDRLQETVDQQGVRVGELQSTVEAKSSRIDLLEETLAELQSKISVGSESADQFSRDLDQRRMQLAEFADRIATQQHQIEIRDQELAEAKRQLEQQQLAERERQHHSQLAQQRTIDGLNQNAQQWIAERDVLVAQMGASRDRIKELESELGQWAVHESPINEVKRLSKELSRRIGDHARERAALLQRIEQLGTAAQLSRAA